MSNFDKKYKANLSGALFGLTLDADAKAPLQAQLLGALRDLILADPGFAGARLPASRVLAAEMSVSRTTVQAVYEQLISEGYLTTQPGSGTFVADDLPHLTSPSGTHKQERARVDDWRVFRVGLPDQRLLPHRIWARHLERAWRDPAPDLLSRPDPFGWYPLRQAIADHLAAWRHLECGAEQIVITSGAWEALDLVCRGLLRPGSRVAVEDPCWPKSHQILASAGGKAEPHRIDAHGLDVPLIRKGIDAAIVTPSRHYPTGRSLPLARRIALRDWAMRNDALIIEDDYDSEFRYRGQPLPSLAGLDGLTHTIYLGSFSKLISNSLRLGYVVLPRRVVPLAMRYYEQMGPRASLVPQPALAAFMESGDFAVHLRRMRRIYARRQAHLLKALAPLQYLLDIAPDPSGMHLCLPLKPALTQRLTDQDIAAHARAADMEIGALSAHCLLPAPMQALLLGYAAFDEQRLSDGAQRLIDLLTP